MGARPRQQGAVVWSRQVGLGLDTGGGAIMWGSAADDRLGYFPVTRASRPLGLAALHLADRRDRVARLAG